MSRVINDDSIVSKLPAYELVQSEKLEDINSFGLILKHKKSGARIAVISCDDNNKVFSIGFRTPPADSTGVAHIIEHTVLCGSKSFPVKDPFIELCKGSLNTFLNAMTYPDKTVYPIASCNDKDFQNLMHVYLDAVFYPNIYKRREIFEQEGWHYELSSPEDELTYNGVVYNEMKGAFSSPDSVLTRANMRYLYPDTSYSVESGGDPDHIPELTYEDYLAFHQKYYHPSNSYIYLYGDMDVEEKLNWLDEEYLNNFDLLQVESTVKAQPAFDEMKKVELFYPVGENDSTENKAYLSYNFSIGKRVDQELSLAFEILEKVLLAAPGAPLKQALLDANIGDNVESGYRDEILQPMLSITVKNSNADKLDEFVKVVRDTLTKLVEQGLDQKSLKAAVSSSLFMYRESDFGRFPKGLMYGLGMLSTWLHDDKAAFSTLHENEIFAALEEKIGTRYFEDLIQKYLIDNPHSCVISLLPEPGLNTRKEEALKNKLAAYKAGLSKAEIEQVIADTKNLLKYQEEPSSSEELKTIPMLAVSDIKKDALPLSIQEYEESGIKVIHHDIHTNGIIYLKMLFKLDRCPKELTPYIGLLGYTLGVIDTKQRSYLDFANDMNIATGGIATSVYSYGKRGSSKEFTPVLAVDTKVLYKQLPKAMELITEMITESKLDDTKRMEEIILEVKSSLQRKFLASGHVVAMERAISYYSPEACFEQETRGISFFDFLKKLAEDYQERKAEMVNILQSLIHYVFRPENLILSVTCPKEGLDQVLGHVNEFKQHLSQRNISFSDSEFQPVRLNEGFKIPGQVQYVATVGNLFDAGFKYNGALRVLKTIMGYVYLWNNVRIKGGAYGCMNNFSGVDGNCYFISYRDPNLKATKEVYENAGQYVRDFEADDREMTKFIIGTISEMDTPLTPAQRGARSIGAYMAGTTFDVIQKDRDEVLNATVKDIRALADLVNAIGNSEYFCVIGNENKIEEDADLFLETKTLL